MLMLFPLELSGVSMYSYNSTTSEINTYIRWSLIGWLGFENEKEIISNIQEFENNEYAMIVCWLLVFIIFQLYYIIKEKLIKKKSINKWSYFSYNLKYAMINYLSLYLWNLNVLVNMKNNNFWFVLINLLIFNCIAFWFPGLLFNFIYGDKLYVYRIKYDFLINNFFLKYKYFSIILLAFKALVGLYFIFFYLFYLGSKYYLLGTLISFSILVFYKSLFVNRNIKYYLLKINLISMLTISLSIVEDYYPNIIELVLTKLVLIIFQIILIIYYYYKDYKSRTNNNFSENNPFVIN